MGSRLVPASSMFILISCASVSDHAYVPADLVAECERSASSLILPEDPASQRVEPLAPGGQSAARETLEADRSVEQRDDAEGLAAWPRHVLVNRCLVGAGATLSDEALAELAEWEARSATP